MNQIEAMKKALEALQWESGGEPIGTLTADAITALRAAIEEAEQAQPVEYWTVADGWVSEQAEVPAAVWVEPEFWDHLQSVNCATAYRLPGEGRTPLYTAPPPRKWVGLTDEEKQQFAVAYYPSSWDRKTAVKLMDDYEAYLKEKNS